MSFAPAVLVQALAGLLRPGLDHRLRPAWSLLHVWIGRASILAGIANVYIGIYVYRNYSLYIVKYMPWVVPVTASLGIILMMYIVLVLYRWGIKQRMDKGGHWRAFCTYALRPFACSFLK